MASGVRRDLTPAAPVRVSAEESGAPGAEPGPAARRSRPWSQAGRC